MEDERAGAYERSGREDKRIQSFAWKSLKGETAWKTWVERGEYYQVDFQEIRWLVVD
jgi:hypothetical protein